MPLLDGVTSDHGATRTCQGSSGGPGPWDGQLTLLLFGRYVNGAPRCLAGQWEVKDIAFSFLSLLQFLISDEPKERKGKGEQKKKNRNKT